MNLEKITVLLIFFFGLRAEAQDIKRVQKHIDTLCSAAMFGRGYVREGDKKTAQWIAQQFEKIGLQSFRKTYFQTFPLQVNTFDEEPTFKWGKKSLKVGKDYLPQATSGSGNVKAKPYRLKEEIFTNEEDQKEFLTTNLKNKAIIYPHEWQSRIMSLPDHLFNKFSESPLHIASTKKLVHTVSWAQTSAVSVLVLEEYTQKLPSRVHACVGSNLKKVFSQNVVGYVSGTSQPDSFIVFTAHYDHLGGIGKSVFFPGANDNASGVAMLLELAYYFNDNPHAYSIVFIAFGAEEAGLIGSRYFVENPLFPLSNIAWVMNLDLVATGEKGATVVNGTVFKEDFDKLVAINAEKGYLPALYARGKAANSDHYFFSEKGVKSFFIYLMGDWSHYHDVEDRPPVPRSKF
ncbi:MAG: M28 family peptidase [Flammeovirgaceae bacterium]|nr:M28 family peptidase [Flammeovirgaceae bacterium]